MPLKTNGYDICGIGEHMLIGTPSLLGVEVQYWVLSIFATAMAIYFGNGKRGKILCATLTFVVVGCWMGMGAMWAHERNILLKESWAYFQKLCNEKSGERIYEGYAEVNSVLVVKALPPATDRDLKEQFWYGDPYSVSEAGNDRGMLAAKKLIGSKSNLLRELKFVEFKNDKGDGYVQISPPHPPQSYHPSIVYVQTPVNEPVSRFGVSWEDISTPEDRKHWTAGSRFRVIDLANKRVVAERIGYVVGLLPYATTTRDFIPFWFDHVKSRDDAHATSERARRIEPNRCPRV